VGLWLAGISHTGLLGGVASVPDITFTGIQMPNRVDPLSYGPLMNWWRVAQINTETGGMISIRYSDRDCVAGWRMPASPDSNSPVADWFHKYVVVAVSETDLTGGSPRVANTYTYVGNPAWHFDDDDGRVPLSRKSWAQWRRYGDVQVYHGDPGEQSETDTLYFRGMDGDKLAAGGTKSVQVIASDGVVCTDTDALAGSAHEQTVYNGPGGPVVSGTISDPWLSAPTATRTINGTTVSARHSGTAVATSRMALDGLRGWRTTKVVNTYDGYGMIANPANLAYQYLVRTNGAVAVTSQRLNPAGNYVTSSALYDGLLRPRQTQAPSPGGSGGMVLTDTLYNTAGQVKTSYGAYYNIGSPGVNLLTPVDPTLMDNQTATVYDGVGRVVASIFQPGGRENWRTTTAYGATGWTSPRPRVAPRPRP
jgi:hypothetical protein